MLGRGLDADNQPGVCVAKGKNRRPKWVGTRWWEGDSADRPLNYAREAGSIRKLRLATAAYVRIVYPTRPKLRTMARHADLIEAAADEPQSPGSRSVPHWVYDLARGQSSHTQVGDAAGLVLYYATERYPI